MKIKTPETKNGIEAVQNGMKITIYKDYGTLSATDSGWETKLKYVAWGEHPPKFDLRVWKETEDEIRWGKGMTLSAEQLGNLLDILKQMETETE